MLGTIGNLTVADLPDGVTFADLIVKFQMIEFLQRQLVPGMSQDDTVLCIIEVIGAFTTEHEAARLRNGQPVPLLKKADFERISAVGEGETVIATTMGKLVALTKYSAGAVRPVRVLNI